MRGPHWGILAQGRGRTGRAQRGPYKNDRKPIFHSKARASSVSTLHIVYYVAFGPWLFIEFADFPKQETHGL